MRRLLEAPTFEIVWRNVHILLIQCSLIGTDTYYKFTKQKHLPLWMPTHVHIKVPVQHSLGNIQRILDTPKNQKVSQDLTAQADLDKRFFKNKRLIIALQLRNRCSDRCMDETPLLILKLTIAVWLVLKTFRVLKPWTSCLSSFSYNCQRLVTTAVRFSFSMTFHSCWRGSGVFLSSRWETCFCPPFWPDMEISQIMAISLVLLSLANGEAHRYRR